MVSWLTELDGSYSLIRQNTGKKWAMEQTIASLSKDDYSAYINLKLRGGALQRGVKKHVVKIDRLMRPRRIANVLAGFTTPLINGRKYMGELGVITLINGPKLMVNWELEPL